MADKTMKGKIIDVWANPPTAEMFKRLPETQRLLKQSHSPALSWQGKGVSPKDLVKQLDEAGVDKIMMCGWNRPGVVVASNDEVAKYVKAYPDRFIGIVSVDLHKPLQAVRTIDKYVKEYGFKGVRVVPWLWDKAPTHRYYYPIFVKCIELDIPFCTQVGHTGPLCPSEVGRPVPYIDRVALDFPELKIVCGHIGYPWTAEMIGVAWKHKNVFIDTSAWLPRYYPKELMHFANSYGKYKVMFGTNFPQLMFKPCADQALKLPLSKKNKALFLYENAARVFKLNDKAKKTLSAKL